MPTLEERKANTQKFLERQAAYYNGILNIPQEAVKYAGLGANWIGNQVGLRDDQEAASAAKAITQLTDNPLWQEANDQRNSLAQQNPEMNTLGNVVGSSLTGSRLYKAILDNLAKVPKYLPAGYTLKPTASGAVVATGNEAITEPFLNSRY